MSSLTAKEKLRALGVKSPSEQNNPYLDIFQAIEDAKSYSTFSSDVNNNQSSFSDFETYLTNTIGISSSDATQFRQKMEQKYTDFSDFQSSLSGFSSYDEWINSFTWGTTLAGDTISSGGSGGGSIAAGIRIHGEAGVSLDGVNVPKGTLELFAPRIEFSEAPAPIDAATAFSTTNLSVDDTVPTPNQTITISADVTNNSGYALDHTVKYLEDGQVIKTKTLNFDASETKSVSFTRSYDDYVSVDVQINDSSTITVSVAPANLQP